MSRGGRVFRFVTIRGSIAEVLSDRGLASLGDAYVNFLYSLALSNRTGKLQGVKVKGSVLAEGLRKAGLRNCLGSRMTRHAIADAAEALLVYGWLNKFVTMDESLAELEKTDDAVEGFSLLLEKTKKRVTFL